MRPFAWRVLAILALALTTLVACRRGPALQPTDPVLDATRAEERKEHLTYAESQGRSLFIHYCATCHGATGQGDGQNASNLDPPPPDMVNPKAPRDAALIRRVIAEGSAAVGRSALSPPYGRTLSQQQIDYLVLYCESLNGKKPQ